MDIIKEIESNFRSSKGILKDTHGRVVNLDKFLVFLSRYKAFTYEDAEAVYKEAIEKLDRKNKHTEISISAQEVFKDFIAKGDGKKSSLIYYKTKDNELLPLGMGVDLDSKKLTTIFSNLFTMKPTLERWKSLIKPYEDLLNIHYVPEIISYFWEKGFTGPLDMPLEKIDFESSPCLLEGFGKGYEYTIPFTQNESNLDQLHPILRDFLERVEDHKYLCAILATAFLGKKKHYIPWLTGKGGEGKSTFMRFLTKIVNGCTTEIKLSEPFSLWNAIGKTFLFMPDTKNRNIFHYDEVKNISGGDEIQVNGKYKQPVNLRLPAMIIISSNKLPNIGNYEYAKRRARVFKIKSGDHSNTVTELTVEDASSAMYSTANEFLNYCLQCLRETGNIETGYVSGPPSSVTHQTKSLEEYEYEDFMEDNELIFDKNLICKGKELRTKLNVVSRTKESFFTENFLEYIQNYCGVTHNSSGDYVGIGRKYKNNGHTERK